MLYVFHSVITRAHVVEALLLVGLTRVRLVHQRLSAGFQCDSSSGCENLDVTPYLLQNNEQNL